MQSMTMRVLFFTLFYVYFSNQYVRAQEYTSVAADYISLYQKYFSPYKNGNCSHYPHCSDYAMRVFEDRSFLDALMLTSERLIRCGYDRNMYETTFASGRRSVLDFPPYQKYPFKLAYREKIYPHVDIKKEIEPSKIGFVDMLINQSDYQSALLEIDRLIYFKDVNVSETFTRRLKCYLGLNQIDRGIYYYEKVIKPFEIKYPDTQLQAGLLYYMTEGYDKSLSALDENAIKLHCDSNYCSKIYALKGVASFGQGKNEQASSYLDSAFYYNPTSKIQHDKNVEIMKQWKTFKPKSATTASILSIIPGLGYWYTGHKGSAISAFLFDAIFGYAAYTSFSNKNYGVGALFSILTTSFYIGNIRGAGESAKRRNRIRKKEIQEELEINNQVYINY